MCYARYHLRPVGAPITYGYFYHDSCDSGIISLLIKEAARCEAYASDIYYDIKSLYALTLNPSEEKPDAWYPIGFRDNGVNGPAYFEYGREWNYRAIYLVRFDYKEGKMELYRAENDPVRRELDARLNHIRKANEPVYKANLIVKLDHITRFLADCGLITERERQDYLERSANL